MVKVYGMSERYKGGEYQETTMVHDPRLADGWIKKSDFDRAISLLKAQNEALEYARSKLLENFTPSGRTVGEVDLAIKKVEQFLEECK